MKFNIGKSVLIVEPNPYHGVILPGFTHYFQSLNFNVDILIRLECKNEKPFAWYPQEKVPTIFYKSAPDIKKFLNSKQIQNYDYIFFSSNAYWEPGVYQNSYIKFLNFIPKPKIAALFIEHNLNHLAEDDCEIMYLAKRVYTLFPFKYKGGLTKMINPHYFGNVKITQKSQITHFIVVGLINSENKNFDILLQSAKKLANRGYRFKISIIGEGTVNIPKQLKNYVKLLGKLDFSAMYKYVEDADFFLPLLDYANTHHKRYLEETTTGSYLLILGFQKIAIINSVFGKFYGFNSQNSLLYKDNKLYEQMIRAILMNQNNYAVLQRNLNSLSCKIQDISKENLFNYLEILNKTPPFLIVCEDIIQLYLARLSKIKQDIVFFFHVFFKKIALKYSNQK